MNSRESDIPEDQDIEIVELCKISEMSLHKQTKIFENPTAPTHSSPPSSIFEDEDLSNKKTAGSQFPFGSIRGSK